MTHIVLPNSIWRTFCFCHYEEILASDCDVITVVTMKNRSVSDSTSAV
ncbi:protein of unknown function [Vibrio tapetis subsp. tapetis]|uniref:Uncharacterized protein n=1 Tax=Vibrio tapetis subsp. tapetis TaxID=1671868 RepID=A0A2N8ZDE3_9VIBR|nr:protein of unknown function [Vibrio tapetis subsp. tapetis]